MSWTPTVEQQDILTASDNLLIIGGAGSGKTTVALQKARRFVGENDLAPDQQVLFLSFSNAAVRRIQDAARLTLQYRERRKIAVTTFHSFCHEVLSAHWRLAGLGAPFKLLSPGAVTVMETRLGTDEDPEAAVLALEKEGQVSFDRYAPIVATLFDRVMALHQAYASAYPLVIVDEYQDTADSEHELTRRLGHHGQLICCGDPKQRIYDFRPGTRSDRLREAQADFDLRQITLTQNHRSAEADIEEVAAAILSGESRIPKPRRVHVETYVTDHDLAEGLKKLIVALERAIRRYTRQPAREVSIAIMCRTNVFVGTTSRLLTSPSKAFPRPFRHQILLPQEGLAMAWEAVATVMAPGRSVTAKTSDVLRAAARLDRWEGGSSKTRIDHAEKLEDWAASIDDGTLSRRARGVHQLRERIGGRIANLSGDPGVDGVAVREAFRGLAGEHLRHVVRLLDLRPFGVNATRLMTDLAEAYRLTDEYVRVESLVARHLLSERLQGDGDAGSGRVLMTMHKCKGREFDAAIIVDGRAHRSIVFRNERGQATQPESRRLLATSIQRARVAAVIFTSQVEPCPLIPRFAGRR